jgi:hypothetical protein
MKHAPDVMMTLDYLETQKVLLEAADIALAIMGANPTHVRLTPRDFLVVLRRRVEKLAGLVDDEISRREAEGDGKATAPPGLEDALEAASRAVSEGVRARIVKQLSGIDPDAPKDEPLVGQYL